MNAALSTGAPPSPAIGRAPSYSVEVAAAVTLCVDAWDVQRNIRTLSLLEQGLEHQFRTSLAALRSRPSLRVPATSR
jgi:hypothetical protein